MLLYIVALSAVGFALLIPPAQLAARGALRIVVGHVAARQRAGALVLGVAVGAVAAVIAVGAIFGAQATLGVALLTLLVCLAVVDLVWRWLPVEWCGLVAALGFAHAFAEGTLLLAALGALVGGGLLFSLRTFYLRVREIEALGLGDVWLAAALGTVVGPERIVWLMGVAAVLGLVFYILCRSARDRQMGVAFGAQMALATPIILSF